MIAFHPYMGTPGYKVEYSRCQSFTARRGPVASGASRQSREGLLSARRGPVHSSASHYKSYKYKIHKL